MNPAAQGRLLLVVFLFCCFDARAQTDAAATTPDQNSAFAAGEEAFAEQDYRRALTFFEAAIAAGSDGPAAHYNRAVCLYQLGEFAEAAAAFGALARDFPSMRQLADYNLGLAEVRLGNENEAIGAFRRASRGESDEVAALATTMISRLEPEPAEFTAQPWIRLINLRFGHDDNVALLDELGLPPGSSGDSAFHELMVYAGGPVTSSERLSLDASLFSIQYPDADEFDQIAIYLQLRYAWTQGAWSASAGPQIGRTELGGNGFDRSIGARMRFGRSLGDRGAFVDVDLRHDDFDSLAARYDYIEGQRTQATLSLGTMLQSIRLTGAYTMERDDRAGPGVDADRDRYRLSFRRRVTPGWIGEIRLEHRESDYSRLATPRSESRNEAGIRASSTFDSAWRVELELRLAGNDSSDPLYDFDRRLVAVGIGRSF